MLIKPKKNDLHQIITNFCHIKQVYIHTKAHTQTNKHTHTHTNKINTTRTQTCSQSPIKLLINGHSISHA